MELERGRDARRRKYQAKDREKEVEKRVIILTKAKDAKPDETSQRTIILKTRDGVKPILPNQSAATSSSRESAERSSPYVLLSRSSVPFKPVVQVPEPQSMNESVQFLDETSLTLNEGLLDYLSESTGFLVVGCLGMQGVGKSEIMSRLARSADADSAEPPIFRVQGKSHTDSGSHCTEGIRCYVNNRRMILLDTQPLLSLSLLNKYYANDGAGLPLHTHQRDEADSSFLENDLEVFYIQFVTFLLSVCHIVLVVQDYFNEPDLIRILHIAESLKPPSSSQLDEKPHNYYPHLFFVHNKCPQSSFLSSTVKTMQDTYAAMFSHSRLLCQSNVGIASGLFLPSLGLELCESDPPVNLCLVPERRALYQRCDYQVKTYDEAIEFLLSQIHCVQPMPFMQSPLTEKNWFHFAAKMWDTIKKSPMFVEYRRILPTSSSFCAEP